MKKQIGEKFFEWDDNKAEINKRKHGISFEKAALVFEDMFRINHRDNLHSDFEERYITIGKVDDVLYVVHTDRIDATRIISARKAKKKERREYYGNN